MASRESTLKVKKFRIRPRIPTVRKILKSLMGTNALSTELQASLPDESDHLLKLVYPVAFYQTWSQNVMPESFRVILEEAGLGKALSVSALIATIGQGPEEEISKLLMNGETNRSHVMTAISEESADLAFQFLMKLLVDDAKQDDCEVSEPIPIKEETLLAETLTHLDAKEENIEIDQAQHLSPRFTRVALAAWLPISKKKKNKSLAKKR